MERFLQINTISLTVFGISIFGIFKWFYEKIKKLFEQQQREIWKDIEGFESEIRKRN